MTYYQAFKFSVHITVMHVARSVFFFIGLWVCMQNGLLCIWQPVYMATSDHLSSHPTKDGRATDSCFL